MATAPPKPVPPKPGIYYSVDFDEYAAWDAVNFSSLKAAMKSWRHYQHEKTKPRVQTEPMRFGSFVHTVLFEPECLLDRYVTMPDFYQKMIDTYPEKYGDPKKRKGIRNTKEYRDLVEAFELQHIHCEMISHEWNHAAKEIRANVAKSPRAVEALSGRTDAEVSIVWEDDDTGLLLKARLDLVRWEAQSITDGKTTSKLAKFERELVDRLYYCQAAYYIDGLAKVNRGEVFDFDILAIESEAPYDNRTARLSDAALEAGRRTNQRLLRGLAECLNTNNWPGCSDPLEWTVPGYIEAETFDSEITEDETFA